MTPDSRYPLISALFFSRKSEEFDTWHSISVGAVVCTARAHHVFANQNGGLKYFEIFFVIILNITVFVVAAREGVYISEKHQQAMLASSDYKINEASHTSISSTLNTERQEQIRKNRHYLKTVLEIIKFCSFQEIALRGHREVAAINRGNFLELLV